MAIVFLTSWGWFVPKLTVKELLNVLANQKSVIESQVAKLAIVEDKNRELSIRASGAEGASRLHRLWWKQAEKKYQRASWEYHGAMMKLVDIEVVSAGKESRGE